MTDKVPQELTELAGKEASEIGKCAEWLDFRRKLSSPALTELAGDETSKTGESAEQPDLWE